MSVIPSANTSPSALFPGLLGAIASDSEASGASQGSLRSVPDVDGTPSFASIFEQTAQQFSGPLQQGNPVAESVPPAQSLYDVLSGNTQPSRPIVESEDDINVSKWALPALFVTAGAVVELPEESVSFDESQLDPETDSGAPQQPEMVTAGVGEFIDDEDLLDSVPQSTSPLADEIASAENSSNQSPQNVTTDSEGNVSVVPESVPVNDTAISDLGRSDVSPVETARTKPDSSVLNDLRADLSRQFGVPGNQRRFASRTGLQAATTMPAVATPKAQSSVLDPGLQNAVFSDSTVEPGDQSRSRSELAEILPTPTDAVGNVGNRHSAALPSNIFGVDRTNSAPTTAERPLSSAGQNPVPEFVPVRERPLVVEANSLSPDSARVNAAESLQGSHSAQPVADVNPPEVAASSDTVAQQKSVVAGGVSESNRVQNSARSVESEVSEAVQEPTPEMSDSDSVTIIQQETGEFSERSGQSPMTLDSDTGNQKTALGTNESPVAEGFEAASLEADTKLRPVSQMPDSVQTMDADLDLLQQLLPRESATSIAGSGGSSLVDSSSPEQLETLSLPRQIATRVLSEAELLESGNSSTFRMKLDPPELGSVMIEMQKTLMGTTITVTAADAATQQLLQDSLHNLNQSNSGEPGLFDSLTFDLANGEQGQQQDQQDRQANSRVIRMASPDTESKGSDTDSQTTSEVDFVA